MRRRNFYRQWSEKPINKPVVDSSRTRYADPEKNWRNGFRATRVPFGCCSEPSGLGAFCNSYTVHEADQKNTWLSAQNELPRARHRASRSKGVLKGMSRTLLMPAVFAALLVTALPAFGQSAPVGSTTPAGPAATTATPSTAEPGEDAFEDNLERWNRVLNRVEEQLKAEDLSLAVLGELQATLDGVREQGSLARSPVQKEADRVGALLQALGPPPQEGEEPETDNLAAQRRDLNQQLSVPVGQQKELELLAQQTSLLASQIAEADKRVRTAQLLVRTPSPLSFESWRKVSSELSALGTRVLAASRAWFRSPEIRGTIGTAYFAAGLFAVFVAAVIGWYVRRWLLRRFGRKPEVAEPSYRVRVLAALASATAYITIPILVAGVAYGALATGGLLVGTFGHLMYGIVDAVVWVSVLIGLPFAMLSPSMPRWRLVRMGDLAARLWYRRALVIAAILGIDGLIVHPLAALEPSLLLQFTYTFIVNSAVAAVTLAVVLDQRLWRTPEEETRAIAIEAGTPPGPPLDKSVRRSRWWLVGRLLMGALALAIPISDLAGFGVLADHITRRMALTGGILLVAYRCPWSGARHGRRLHA